MLHPAQEGKPPPLFFITGRVVVNICVEGQMHPSCLEQQSEAEDSFIHLFVLLFSGIA